MHVNLIPLELRLRLLARRHLRRWGIAWAALLLGGAFVVASQYRLVCAGQTRLVSLDARVRPLEKVEEQTAALESRLQTLQAERKLLQTAEPTDHSLAVIMILSSAAHSVGEPLQIQQMRLINERNVVTADAQNPPSDSRVPAQRSTLTLQGVATSDHALTSFVDALRQSPPLQQVELKSSSQWQTEAFSGRQFQVECRFEE